MTKRTPLSKEDLVPLGVAAGVTLVAYLAGVSPALSARRTEASLHEQIRAAQSHSFLLRAEDQEAAQRVEELRASAAGAVRLQPVTQLNQRLGTLMQAAGAAGIAIDGLQPTTPMFGKSSGIQPVHVRARGSFAASRDFLHVLNRDFPDISVQAFDINGTFSDAEEGSFTVTLAWHILPPEQAAPK